MRYSLALAASLCGVFVAACASEPTIARTSTAASCATGYVVVQFRVLADGTVVDLKVLESQPPCMFDAQALKVVENWKWKTDVPGFTPESLRKQTINFNVDGCTPSGNAPQSNQPLHPTTSGGLTAAVVAGERRR
jgi:TonB family protein